MVSAYRLSAFTFARFFSELTGVQLSSLLNTKASSAGTWATAGGLDGGVKGGLDDGKGRGKGII